VILSLLPSRALDESDTRREEHARLAAITAVVLPIAAIALALVVRPDADPFGHTDTDAGAMPVSVAPSAAVDPTVTLLDGMERSASLIGTATDERHVVASPDGVFVLNVALDRVDVVADSATSAVLTAGQAVGADVVATLVDLFLLRSVDERDLAVVLDAGDRLWALEGGAVEAVPVAAYPIWLSAYRGAGYDGRLYVLDRGSGQIVRYMPAAGGFGAVGEPWLASSQDMSGAVDLAIDGTVFVLFGDGTLRRYTDGSEIGFESGDVPGGIGRSAAVYASPTAGRILVADRENGRIVVLRTDGGFETQLLPVPNDSLPDGKLVDLHSIWFDEGRQLLHIVSGGSLYSSPYR
jgi:hypothetical protein